MLMAELPLVTETPATTTCRWRKGSECSFPLYPSVMPAITDVHCGRCEFRDKDCAAPYSRATIIRALAKMLSGMNVSGKVVPFRAKACYWRSKRPLRDAAGKPILREIVSYRKR